MNTDMVTILLIVAIAYLMIDKLKGKNREVSVNMVPEKFEDQILLQIQAEGF